MPEPTWKKSTFSSDGDCVEVFRMPGNGAVVRDSERPSGFVLRFDESKWKAFLDGVKDGQFD